MSSKTTSADTAPAGIRNVWLCRTDDTKVQPEFCHLVLAKGRIKETRPADFRAFLRGKKRPPQGTPDASGALPRPDGIDAGGRVATPPPVNFHDHFYSRLAKGLSLPGPTDTFKGILESFWWQLDRVLDADMIDACARIAILESIKSGVTYVFDHHSSPGYIRGSLDIIAEASSDFGTRGVFCFETSDRNGEQVALESLEEQRDFIRRRTDSDIRGLVGLHAPFTLSDRTLGKAAALCSDMETGIHIHLAEDRCEQDHSRSSYGMAPAARLKRFALLENPGILVHGVHLGPEDWQAISTGSCALALNPDSNLNNAVGLPALAAIPASIPVLAGTDGMHGNPLRSLKQLFLLYRHQGNSIAESFDWLRRLFFAQLRFLKIFFPDYPDLRDGARADLVIWDYRPPSPFNGETFWGHLVYGIFESPARWVLMQGRTLLNEGRICIEDSESMYSNAALQGARLFKTLGVQANG